MQKLHIASVGGIGFTDEQQQNLTAADYARNCDFTAPGAMILPLKEPVNEWASNFETLETMAAYEDGSILMVGQVRDASDGLVRTAQRKVGGSIFAVTIDDDAPSSLRPSYARFRKELRIAADGVARVTTTDLQAAALKRPVLTTANVVAKSLRSEVGCTVDAITYTDLGGGNYVMYVDITLDIPDDIWYANRYEAVLRSLLNIYNAVELSIYNAADLPRGRMPYTVTNVVRQNNPEVVTATLRWEGQLSYSPGNSSIAAKGLLHLGMDSLSRISGGTSQKLFYAVSFEFDGYQEGPLSDPAFVSLMPEDTTVKLPIDINTIPERVTGLHVYKAFSADLSSSEPETTYTYVGYIPVSGAPVNTSIEDVVAEIRESYKERTGVLETIRDMVIDARLVAMDGRYMFYADVRIRDEAGNQRADLSMAVVRSQPYRPDMVNWVEDVLYLPEQPTAMRESGGRLYVWTRQHLYVLDADLRILERLNGMGVDSQLATASWDQGVTWANKKGWWVYDGATLANVGTLIQSRARTKVATGVTYYELADHALEDIDNIVLGAWPSRGAVLLWGGIVSNTPWAWVYYIAERQLVLYMPTSITNYTEPRLLDTVTGRSIAVMYSPSGKFDVLTVPGYGTAANTKYVWRSVDLARGERFRLYDAYINVGDRGGSTQPLQLDVYYERSDGRITTQMQSQSGPQGTVAFVYAPPIEARRLHIQLFGDVPVENIMLRVRRLGR